MENPDTTFDLGQLIKYHPRPRFEATAGGLPCIVELDSSAMIKLAGTDIGADATAQILSKAPQIRATAQRLHRQGFVAQDSNGPLIVISAIDLY